MTARRLLILTGLLILFVVPAIATLPAAKAVTTTNCTIVGQVTTCSPGGGGGGDVSQTTERKVFYANQYWWIFWATGSAIDYQSCAMPTPLPGNTPTACDSQSDWSAAAIFTNVGDAVAGSGQGFSAVLDGNQLVYAVAPTTGGANFFWGVANLQNTGVVSFTAAQNIAQPLQAGHTGQAADTISITIDGNGYVWVAVQTTLGIHSFEDVFECPQANPVNCNGATWYTSTVIQETEFSNNYQTNPEVLPLANPPGTYFVALVYVDVQNANIGGSLTIDVSPSGTQVGNVIQWQTSCGGGATGNAPGPCLSTQNSLSSGGNGGDEYSAASSGASLFVVANLAANTMASYAYTEGSAVAALTSSYDPWQLATAYTPAVSVSGTTVIDTWTPANGPVEWEWISQANALSGANTWSGATGLASNTEWAPGNPSASFASYSVGGYNLIGVIWDNLQTNPLPNTNRIRFALESVGNAGPVNFPVSVTLELGQYNLPASMRSALSATNYFTLAYTAFIGGVPLSNTTYYAYNTPTVQTIKNVESYSNFLISQQTSASTGGEKWCLIYGGNCGGGFQNLDASDGVQLSYYYYDQLYEPNLYAIASPNIMSIWATSTESLGTVNYESTNPGFPVANAGGFVFNPTYSTTYASPHIQLFTSAQGYDLFAQWARTRDNLLSCTGLTISQAVIPNGGTTCAPSVSFESTFGSALAANANGVTVPGNPWAAGQWVGYSLTFVNGPAAGLTEPITSSTTNSLSTTVAFNPAPAAGNSFNIVVPGGLSVNYPTGVTIPGVGPTLVQDYVPVVLSNSESSATAAGFPQLVTVNSNTFKQYETGNLQNVEFFNAAGTVLNSWLESGNTNTATTTNYWVNLGASTIPAGTAGTSQYSGTSTSVTAFSGTSTAATNLVLTDAGQAWVANSFVGDYLDYTSGNANGQELPIYANTANTITVGIAFNPAPSGVSNFSVVAGVTPTVLTDSAAAWTASQWIGYYLEYTNGPAAGQFQPITANTPTTITTAAAIFPNPTINGGDTFKIVGVNPGTLTIYMGFVPTGTNLFAAAGPVGEAPQLSSTYGLYDDGSSVFTYYTNFAGALLPASLTALPNAGETTTVNNGITFTTNAASQWGGVEITNGYAPGTTIEGDVLQATGTAAGFEAQVALGAASNGYWFNSWVGSTAYGNMQNSDSHQSGSPGLPADTTPKVGIEGMSWANYNTQYYYNDYSLVGGTAGLIAQPGSIFYTFGIYNGSPSTTFALQWLRLRATAPGGVMPTAIVGPVTPGNGAPASISAFIPVTITNNQALSTPAYYQVDVNATSSSYFPYENALLQNVEFFTDPNLLTTAGTVVPSWLESGNSNTASNTVYWVRLPNSLPASGGTTTIYMGFAAITNNLFQLSGYYNGGNGYVGEAPTLSPSYGAYDNGANVFNFYDNFAGNALDANWQTTSTLASNQGFQLVPGQENGNACVPDIGLVLGSATLPGVAAVDYPFGEAFDSSGNLWVADKCDNRVLEYSAASLSSSNPQPILVIGQTGLAAGTANEGQSTTSAGLNSPTGLAFDAAGDLWVSDSANNRVLEYKTPLTTGETASIVLGQATMAGNAVNQGCGCTSSQDLDGPTGLKFDSSGNLWVADTFNNRVIMYPVASLVASDAAATIAVGQVNLTGQGSNFTPTTLWQPTGIAFDSSGNLWVADTENSRVLRYTAASLSADGPAATVLVGQWQYTSWQGNMQTGIVSGTGFYNPTGVAFDAAGNLWVSDDLNNRVVEFSAASIGSTATGPQSGTATSSTTTVLTDTSVSWTANQWVGDLLRYTNGNDVSVTEPIISNTPTTITTPAFPLNPGAATFFIELNPKEVVGQTVATASLPDGGSTVSATGLYVPTSIAFSGNDLWVADSLNNRILHFTAASLAANGPAAAVVVGQSGFTWGASIGGTTEANSQNQPTDEAFDPSGNLWVVDTGNNRILEYPAPYYTGESAIKVIGQQLFTTSTFGTTSSTLKDPTAIAFDSAGNLWVSDTGNNRILEFTSPLTTGESAAKVIGQGSFTTAGSGIAGGFNQPQGITFDPAGDLWVADSLNNRVLEFKPAGLVSLTFTPAIVVGQANLTTNAAGTTANTLFDPYGVAIDSYGNLWVADSGNNRVLQFPYFQLSASNPTANLVLGQTLFTTSNQNTGTGTNQGTLYFPTSVAFDHWGTLWVSDTGDSRLLGWQPGYLGTFYNGQVSTFIEGKASINWGIPNGLALNGADYSAPRGITFDSLDALWVADSGNNRVGATSAEQASGGMTVSNGVTVHYTSTTMGIVSTVTMNPQYNVLEVDAYFSSPNSGTQWVGYLQSGGGTSVPTVGNKLYSMADGSIMATNGYIEYNNGAGSSILTGYLTLPLSIPTTSYYDPFYQSSGQVAPDGLEPYPATNYYWPPTGNMGTVGTAWWTLRNSTISVTNALPGQPNERWAASPNGLLWVVVSPYQVAPVDAYYHQYANTFTVVAGGLVTTFDNGVTVQLTGTIYGQLSAPIATFYVGQMTLPEYVDAGTTISYPAQAAGSGLGARWENSNNQSQTAIINAPGACGSLCTATYFKQFETQVQYKTSDGSSLPMGQNPLITYTTFGSPITATIPSNLQPARTAWIDALTSVSLSTTIPGSTPFERWVEPVAIATITCSDEPGAGCLEAFGVTSAGTIATQLVENAAGWTPNEWVGYYLTYTSGPDEGQSLPILSNTATQLNTNAFSMAPDPSGDNFEITGSIASPVEYYHQFEQMFTNYKTSDYLPSTSATIPEFQYSINGTAKQVQLNFTGSTFGLLPGTTTGGTTANVLQDVNAVWAVNQWVGFELEYTSGPAVGQILAITGNTVNTITTGASFAPPPQGAGGDSFEILATTTSATGNVLTDTHANWNVNQWFGYTLEYTTGPAAGQALKITANTAHTITTASAFNPAPTAGGGDQFVVIYITWIDAGTTSMVTTPLPGASGNEQWAADPKSASWSISGSNCQGSQCLPTNPNAAAGVIGTFGNSTILYDHQYMINVITIPQAYMPDSEGLDVSTCPLLTTIWCNGGSNYVLETQGYQLAGATFWQTTPFMIEESGNSTFTASGFSTANTNPICFYPTPSCTDSTAAQNVLTKITGTGPMPSTIFALFEVNQGITFDQSGIPPGAAQWKVTLYGGIFSGYSSSATNTVLTSAGVVGTTTPGTTAAVLQDNTASWINNQWTGYYLAYTSGPATGQSIQISQNTGTSVTTASSFAPAPDATGDTFTITPNWIVNAYAGELLTYTSGPAQGQVISIASNTANTITTLSAFNPVPTAGGGDTFTIINPGVPVVQGQSSTTALLVAQVNGNPLPFDTYYYVVASPVIAFSGYARFLPVQATGTATITAAQPATTVQLTFLPQYRVNATNNPLFTSTVTLTWTNSSGMPAAGVTTGYAVSIWLKPGSSVTFSYSVNPADFVVQPVWLGWTGFNCPALSPCPAATVANANVQGLMSETANFYLPASYIAVPTSADALLGETILPTVVAYGGTGDITLSVDPASIPAGITVAFYICNPGCGAPQANTITFPSSVDLNPLSPQYSSQCTNSPPAPCPGQYVTMEIIVSNSAQVFGPVPITITGSYSGTSNEPAGTCGTAGQPVCPVFTVVIITPEAATVGGTTNPFAIETPDQTALFYANGNWLAFYDNGTQLVYKASPTGVTWPNTNPLSVPDGLVPGALGISGTTTVGTTATVLHDLGAGWTVNEWAGFYLQYTSGNAAPQKLVIVSNTASTLTTAYAFSPAPAGGGGDQFTISAGNDLGVYGYTFAVVVNGNEVYYVLASTDNQTTTSHVRPGNYFYYNWGAVQPSGSITWANANAIPESLCPGQTLLQPCAIYGGGQPAVTISSYNGNFYFYTAIPTLAGGGSCNAVVCWNIEYWTSALSGAPQITPGAWNFIQNIPARATANEPGASSVNVKLLPLSASGVPDGVGLADWIGNDVSMPSVAVYDPTSTSFVLWTNNAPPTLPYEYGCTPTSAGLGPGASAYVLYGEQSDVIAGTGAEGNTLYFAGVSSGGATQGDVIFYQFIYNPNTNSCQPVLGSSSYSAVQLVAGGGTTVPTSPIPGDQWRISLAWQATAGSPEITLAFGLGNDLGTALGTFSAGAWGWYVFPGGVTGVQDLINGLTSTFTVAGGGNVGTVWVEESSANVYQVEFALI